jgi:hypothetical protein
VKTCGDGKDKKRPDYPETTTHPATSNYIILLALLLLLLSSNHDFKTRRG